MCITYIFNACVLLSFKFSAHTYTNIRYIHGCKMFKNADGQGTRIIIHTHLIEYYYTLKLMGTSRGFGMSDYPGTGDKKKK